eukprot:TRINITY_DN1421_c0_g1_i1.p1 TRINITY_DN1421_c0_g1~~TRINITY_DN1421_c0_g1_i1.p1  ORF type:complete len:322 (+),score=94.70 TRINITY_DN1421_c0_g1_i1:137-1102(+)
MTSIQQLFQDTTLGEVLACRSPTSPKTLVHVKDDASVHACLKAMTENKISSVPVFDAQMKVVGMVDMTDVCRALVNELSEVQDWKTWPDLQLSELLQDTPVTKVVDFARGDPLLISTASSSIASIMKFFSAGLAHRCLIHFDKENEYGIVSQIDVASWLAGKIDEDLDLRKSLQSISLMDEVKNRSSETGSIVQAAMTDSVLDILKLMVRENVPAVGLVDETGRLQANFSATDLVHIDAGVLSDVRLSGAEYLKKYARWSLTPLSLLQDQSTSVSDAILIFSGMGLHRVWLVDSPMDSRFSPTGVVTITDVLHIIQTHFLQ